MMVGTVKENKPKLFSTQFGIALNRGMFPQTFWNGFKRGFSQNKNQQGTTLTVVEKSILIKPNPTVFNLMH